jgi:transcriptional regulator with XRE-family HTH domain
MQTRLPEAIVGIKLKQFRVNAGLTQAELAKAAGVSQPSYQRWETGSTPVPDAKLKKLAKVLKTNADALMGRHPPIKAGFYNKSIGADLNYYGEVAVHFNSGGSPLLLSISDGAFSQLHKDMQRNLEFVTVRSLANQTIIIRAQAISDLYFSSEAYDDYGPEHDHYVEHVEIQMPDPRDWEIVDALACDGVGLDEFSPDDIQRITEQVMITDEQYEDLVMEGKIKPEDLDKERVKNQEETDKIFGLSTTTIYQLSTGQKRSAHVFGEDLFKAFYEFTDFGGEIDDGMIHLPIEGWHRTAFINKKTFDYVMFPTHRFIEGRTEVEAKELDELAGV